MITIKLYNFKSRMLGDRREILELREATKIRKPGAFYASSYGNSWDGYIRYISEHNGLVATGLIPKMIKKMEELGIEYQLDDCRTLFKAVGDFSTMHNGDVIRDYQKASALSVLDNKLNGLRFQRGILEEATNAGKSYIAAYIFGSFHKKRTGLLLIDSTDIFNQLYEDLKTLLGPDQVGCMGGKKETPIKRVMVCMVQTLGLRAKKNAKVRQWLSQIDLLLVDECDTTASKKVGKTVLNFTINASVRVGLSGTPLKHKDKTKNEDILAYFGPVLHTTSNAELVNRGVSTPPVISFFPGNEKTLDGTDYATQYDQGITKNKNRNQKVWKRVERHLKKGRCPVVIMIKYKKHVDFLYKTCPDHIAENYRIDWVHSERKDRTPIYTKFVNGKIDILIASMVIQRGKNLPLIKALINASGGDSERGILQIFGRTLRKHGSKKKVYIDEFFDSGLYLRRHSKHRLIYYKNQGFKVKEKYK